MSIVRIWLVVALVAMFSTVPAAPTPVECPALDLRVSAAYPISGYWLIPRADRCLTRRAVQAIHSIGGDTLITFGPRFAPSAVDRAGRVLKGGVVDPDFADCVGCYRDAQRAAGRSTIRRVYTYAADEQFGAGLLRCPGLDSRIEGDGRTFYRVLLGRSCSDSSYDLVLVATDGDGLGNLMAEATTAGIRVFPGLPSAPQDVAKPWLPDLGHLAALNAFTGRILTDYQQRYRASPALGGVYQSFELTMRDRPNNDPTIGLYRAQHAVVAAVMPGTKIMVSPYLDARRGRGFRPDQADDGFAEIAATRAGAPMAISVQDGRGVGKVPLHWGDEADAKVAPRLRPMVGDVSNRTAYYGPVQDYVASAARRVGPGVELWVNVESFEPTPVPGECGRADPMPLRGRTTKSRIDHQIMAAGRHPTKIVSYGWDPFLTCQSGYGTTSLSDDIVAAWNQPIIVHAAWRAGGIVAEGYNLRGGTLQVSGTAVASQQWQTRGALESVWVPFETDRPWVSITATNGAGKSSTSGYVIGR